VVGEEEVAGRRSGAKALIVVAARADGEGIGRIRLRPIQDTSAGSLHTFVVDSIEPGSTVHTDGWQGYQGLDQPGYDHQVTVLRGRRKDASKPLPRVHLVVSLLRRWLLGPHQRAVSHAQLAYLPGRVHVPVQPADVQESGEAVLSAGAAGHGYRSENVRGASRASTQHQATQTTNAGGCLSQANTDLHPHGTAGRPTLLEFADLGYV
jgi:hypothetical protein